MTVICFRIKFELLSFVTSFRFALRLTRPINFLSSFEALYAPFSPGLKPHFWNNVLISISKSSLWGRAHFCVFPKRPSSAFSTTELATALALCGTTNASPSWWIRNAFWSRIRARTSSSFSHSIANPRQSNFAFLAGMARQPTWTLKAKMLQRKEVVDQKQNYKQLVLTVLPSMKISFL